MQLKLSRSYREEGKGKAQRMDRGQGTARTQKMPPGHTSWAERIDTSL